jgi:hypothetical protein
MAATTDKTFAQEEWSLYMLLLFSLLIHLAPLNLLDGAAHI